MHDEDIRDTRRGGHTPCKLHSFVCRDSAGPTDPLCVFEAPPGTYRNELELTTKTNPELMHVWRSACRGMSMREVLARSSLGRYYGTCVGEMLLHRGVGPSSVLAYSIFFGTYVKGSGTNVSSKP